MKNNERVFRLLAAVNLFFLTSCCCLVCKAGLISNGSFENQGASTDGADGDFTNSVWHFESDDYVCKNDLISDGSFENQLVLTNGGNGDLTNGVWHFGSDTYVGLVPNHGPGQSANLESGRFFNTPIGKQSVFIEGNSSGNESNPTGTLSQSIAKKLMAGEIYHLSFFQSSSCYLTNTDGYFAAPGELKVSLISSSGHNILSQLPNFSVPAQSAWVQQMVAIKIPNGGTDTYTIEFSNIGYDTNNPYFYNQNGANPFGFTVAYIDGVSLIKK